MPPRDVSGVVEEYLAEAHRLGFKALRIIHGKGIGVQRDMVRTILARTPFVAEYRDAPMEAGGRGGDTSSEPRRMTLPSGRGSLNTCLAYTAISLERKMPSGQLASTRPL